MLKGLYDAAAGMKARLARVHLPCGFWTKNLAATKFSFLKMGDHEMRDVTSRRRKAAGRSGRQHFERLRMSRTNFIAIRRQRLQFLRQRLSKG